MAVPAAVASVSASFCVSVSSAFVFPASALPISAATACATSMEVAFLTFNKADSTLLQRAMTAGVDFSISASSLALPESSFSPNVPKTAFKSPFFASGVIAVSVVIAVMFLVALAPVIAGRSEASRPTSRVVVVSVPPTLTILAVPAAVFNAVT
jgi:hypothetical protein